MEDNWPTDRIHVFNIKVKDPEEEIVVTHHHFELKVEFHRYASKVGMDLGQHGKLIIWDNRGTFVYDWRSGVRQNEIIVPGGTGDAEWVGFVGPDLWSVMASRLVERLHPKTDLDLLMVYDLSNLTTPDADGKHPPNIILRIPKLANELPKYIRKEFTTLNDQRPRLGPYWPSDGSNGTSDLLHLAVDRTAWNPAYWGEHKALSISLPYFKIRKWLQSNASYAAQSTDGKRYNINDHIIIEATEWTKQTHCAFTSNRPRYISDCHYGSKLVLCENMHDRRQDAEVIAQEGTNADLTGPRRYQITCRDYNSLKVKYNLSTSESELGGLKSIDYVRSDLPVETQNRPESIDYEMSMSLADEEGIPYIQSQCFFDLPRQEPSDLPGSHIEEVFFTGERLYIQGTHGWVDMLDFAA
ncbi:hypothetical protein V865_000091 [Kwoniella europaea PYCC6329]|uniref:Uncharacterized protein n=1 Tax=Kwoniella europaea PYCC6329 TaxID=1423913 RepID=A0AAX4K867_9TREE